MPDHQSIEFLVPFHGDFELFKQAVESVLTQDSPSWRLTVVEDGQLHGDEPQRWLESLGDGRVRYLRNPERLGVAGNFQRLLDVASADYVTFMGCDDLLRSNYVEVVSGLARRYPEADLLHPGVMVVDVEGRPFTPVADRVKRLLAPRQRGPALLQGERLATRLLHGNWAYFPAICWKRATIKPIGFRPDLPTTLDLELLMQVIIPDGRVAVDSTVAFAYRRHRGSASSMTARSGERFREEDRLFEEIGMRADCAGWNGAARAARLHITSRLHRAMVR